MRLPLTNRYRKVCERFEKFSRSSFVPRKHPYSLTLTWEALGLAADMLNACASWDSIERATRYGRHVLVQGIYQHFPELLDDRSWGRLPARKRSKDFELTVVQLHCREGLSFTETARKLNTTKSTIAGVVRDHKAKQRAKQ